jgi:hypothetical protein
MSHLQGDFDMATKCLISMGNQMKLATLLTDPGIWLDDDELTKWCRRCNFAAVPDPDGYKDTASETAAFYAALFEAT